MHYKNIVIKKIKNMPDELLSKVFIFICGMEAQKNISSNEKFYFNSKK